LERIFPECRIIDLASRHGAFYPSQADGRCVVLRINRAGASFPTPLRRIRNRRLVHLQSDDVHHDFHFWVGRAIGGDAARRQEDHRLALLPATFVLRQSRASARGQASGTAIQLYGEMRNRGKARDITSVLACILSRIFFACFIASPYVELLGKDAQRSRCGSAK